MMANQYTQNMVRDDQFWYRKARVEMQLVEEQMVELVAALTRKYKENPDSDTRKLLIIHGVDVWKIDAPGGK